MSEDDKTPKDAEIGDKTVFMPRGTTAPPQTPVAEVPATEVPARKPRSRKTVVDIPKAAETPEEPARISITSQPIVPMKPRTDGDRIQVGDVLNHMFEVRRFIARGGMGEVFEGVNVQSDERVAIKVMLPQLAADPNVQAMFKKEARTLTRLSHPALVQYRVIAQEPQLGVLYIVTEYVDSKNLEDALPGLKPSVADLKTLLRRLADGLRVAHSLGAIHRDISPDNVLLEDGQLAKARIIDFGIAKDLDPSSKTIVGDGFAGKLNFVAPEQLGDFDRQVGPWTDLYSLALVILAVAQGRAVNMGGTLVDAVDKRRQGPDLSGAPEELRPLLGDMLAPNPVNRLRSMDEVIARLDALSAPTAAKPAVQATAAPVAKSAPAPAVSGGPLKPPMVYYIGGVAAVVVIGIIAATTMGSHKAAPADATVAAAPADPQKAARDAIEAVLPSTDCAWLDVTTLTADASGVDLALKGVAADTPAVQGTIAKAFAAKGLKLKSLNTDSVAPINSDVCGLLNEYTHIRTVGPGAMSTPQVNWTMQAWPDAPSVKQARPVVNFSVDPGTPDMVLYGLETSGAVTPLITSKKQLSDAAFLDRFKITDRGNGNYQFAPNQDEPGWSGLLLVEGGGPMDASVLNPDMAHRGADWQQGFRTQAQQKSWHSDMIWLQAIGGS